MNSTIWVLVIEHRYGFNHYANRTKEGMFETLADYIREWWDEHDYLMDSFDEIPTDRQKLINAYFENVDDEWYTFDEVIVKD